MYSVIMYEANLTVAAMGDWRGIRTDAGRPCICTEAFGTRDEAERFIAEARLNGAQYTTVAK